MAYDICKICGRFFPKNSREYCKECYEKDKQEYNIVRDYVLKHRGVNAMEVSNVTGISIKTIYRFIDEERIDIDKKSKINEEEWENGCKKL
ncbi:MAG: hypothetical protein GX308_06900 [Epulopiscium sp.]|nr:hypothetical protein [Candidatus Epulonipiscium sp.]